METAWMEITCRVNAVGQGYTRTVEEVHIKWRDFSGITKKKAASPRMEREKTGGGSISLPPLTPNEERVLAVLGPEAVGVVPGGINVYSLHRNSPSASLLPNAQASTSATMSFPKTPEDIRRVNQEFHAIAGLPRVIGTIDGTLIPITTPYNHGPRYICRSGYPALNVLVAAEGGGFGGCWLLGDNVFSLHPFLLTAYRNAKTEPQVCYNSATECGGSASGASARVPEACNCTPCTALRDSIQMPEGVGFQDQHGTEAEDILPVVQNLYPAGQQVCQELVDNLFGP
ncbi:hypothetical protein ACEWY4_013890 [Coilia grayii]|uniref:Myb/SANT-like DNA-binding domain-containing protein n=1 Tax=Coilia grayii TaxID=363190 RepID=A0ABD1JXP3_9TELE